MKSITNTEQEGFNHDWLFGQHPTGIEIQESIGQRELLQSSQLPVRMGQDGIAKEKYKSLGIEVIGLSKGDDLFFDVVLPTGWVKDGTGHSMWSNLKNEKGEIIAEIFYKAAFYDRDAFIRFN